MNQKAILLSCLLAAQVHAVPNLDIDFEYVIDGLGFPTDITNAGDARLFVAVRSGLIRIVDSSGSLLEAPFLDIEDRVLDGGERGLLGLAFDPEYASNGYFYVNYTRESDGDTVIARFSVSENDPNQADANSENRLLTINQPASNHNAGALAFDPGPEQYLYIPLGDGGPSGNARDMTNLLGTIIRIDVSGADGIAPDCVGEGTGSYSIPSDNPFVDGPGGDCDEAWAFGLRNPFRMSFDRISGDLYVGDVGETSFEEVNHQPAGLSGVDWGWRCKEGFAEYPPGNCDAPLARDPFYVYGRSEGRSVIGGYVYRGSLFPNFVGVYFFNDYFESTVWAAQRDEFDEWNVTKYADALPGTNFATWGASSEGELYVATREGGELYRLVDNSAPNDPPVIAQGASISVEMDEDSFPSLFDLTLSATDDASPDDLAWSISDTPANGDASVSGSGSTVEIDFAPEENFNGSETFQVRVSDAFGGSDTIDVNVNIRPRNDPPQNLSRPIIAGLAVVGGTLDAEIGTWSDSVDLAPGQLQYQYGWQSSNDGVQFEDIPNADQASYAVTLADEGLFIRVVVTATDDGEGLPASQSTAAESDAIQIALDTLLVSNFETAN